MQKFELENKSYLFQYGPTVGSFLIRTNLADFLTKGYQSEVKAADLVLTAGASNGIHLILSTLIDMNGFVFIDELYYMEATLSLKEFSNIEIVPVKLNDDGVDIKDLELKVRERKFQSNCKMFWAVYLTVPAFQNPTGILFSKGEKKIFNCCRFKL